jgi:TPR repeat protein
VVAGRLGSLRRNANKGDAESACRLGEALAARGRRTEAVEWWRRAERLGNARALYHLAVWHDQQGDRQTAEDMWHRAASAGEPLAALAFGQLLLDRGVSGDARRWLTAAAEAGNADGAFELGRLYEHDRNDDAAQRWYRVSAEAGHRGAAAALAVLLDRDSPFDSRSRPSEFWWKRATDGLDSDSARELGQILGLAPEAIAAEQSLRLRYEAGEAMAGYQLARLLQDRGWKAEAREQLSSVVSTTRRMSNRLDRAFRRSYRYRVVALGRTFYPPASPLHPPGPISMLAPGSMNGNFPS